MCSCVRACVRACMVRACGVRAMALRVGGRGQQALLDTALASCMGDFIKGSDTFATSSVTPHERPVSVRSRVC